MRHVDMRKVVTVSKQVVFWIAPALAVGLAALTPARPAASAGGVSLQTVDGAGLKKAVESFKGKPVLLNIWSTTCGPCVKEFPSIVKLHNAYKAKGLVVISVSMDEPEDKAKALAFLQKQKADFPSFIRKGGNVDTFFDPVDKNWLGTMPTTYVFDRKGKMVGAQHGGELTYEKFVAAVQPALK